MAHIRDNQNQPLVCETEGSRGAKYHITTDGNGVISCTCISWRVMKQPIADRICKHIQRELVRRRGRGVAVNPIAPAVQSPRLAPPVPPVPVTRPTTSSPASTDARPGSAVASVPSVRDLLRDETKIPRRTSTGRTLYEDARLAMAEREHNRLLEEAKKKDADAARDPQAQSKAPDYDMRSTVERFRRLELD